MTLNSGDNSPYNVDTSPALKNAFDAHKKSPEEKGKGIKKLVALGIPRDRAEFYIDFIGKYGESTEAVIAATDIMRSKRAGCAIIQASMNEKTAANDERFSEAA